MNMTAVFRAWVFQFRGMFAAMAVTCALTLLGACGVDRGVPSGFCPPGMVYHAGDCVDADPPPVLPPGTGSIDASVPTPPGSCQSGASDCRGNQPMRCDGSGWVPEGSACGPDERCDRRFGCLPDCVPGQRRCVDSAHDQICVGSIVPEWSAPRACDRSLNKVCSPSLRHCAVYEPGCTEGDLTCSGSGEVSECRRQRDGTLAWEAMGTCAEPGYGLCNVVAAVERPRGTSWRFACGNRCGGRGEGCALAHQPGTAVAGTTCASWVCAGACAVEPSRCDCRNTSATCVDSCQCVGRCVGGFCAPR